MNNANGADRSGCAAWCGLLFYDERVPGGPREAGHWGNGFDFREFPFQIRQCDSGQAWCSLACRAARLPPIESTARAKSIDLNEAVKTMLPLPAKSPPVETAKAPVCFECGHTGPRLSMRILKFTRELLCDICLTRALLCDICMTAHEEAIEDEMKFSRNPCRTKPGFIGAGDCRAVALRMDQGGWRQNDGGLLRRRRPRSDGRRGAAGAGGV